jgi:predicted GNAT superfamily acetyltransferase
MDRNLDIDAILALNAANARETSELDRGVLEALPSGALHAAMGFREGGRAVIADGRKTVRYIVREMARA